MGKLSKIKIKVQISTCAKLAAAAAAAVTLAVVSYSLYGTNGKFGPKPAPAIQFLINL